MFACSQCNMTRSILRIVREQLSQGTGRSQNNVRYSYSCRIYYTLLCQPLSLLIDLSETHLEDASVKGVFSLALFSVPSITGLLS